MLKRILSSLLTAAMATSAVMAVPAKRTPMTVTQPDGSEITILKVGDERLHMTLTPDGYPLLRDDAGYYRYATIDADGRLKAGSVKGEAIDRLNAAEKVAVMAIDREAVKAKIIESGRKSPRYKSMAEQDAVSRGNTGGIGLTTSAFVGYKDLKGLVILAQYSDVKFKDANDNAFFTEMLNDDNFTKYSATGSARKYFIDSSMGQFTPDFDVYGPVTLPEKMAYYGGNDSSGDDQRPARMIYDACKGLDDVIDFSKYDQDKDGYVDNVYVIYAGQGEASYGSDDTIWPHQWNLSSGGLSLTLDGVRVNRYACSNELENTTPDGIGTFVHEFSHVLGLPDLYVTDNSLDGNWTPWSWSVLDYGPYNNNGRTPPAYSIFERYAMGWIDPHVLDCAENIELNPIFTTNEGCIIPTSSQNEFFLLENRQQVGWDKYIPGHGMLIWHIDFNKSAWSANRVNNNKNHNYVDIVEASGKVFSYNDVTTSQGYLNRTKLNNELAKYAFPGTLGVTSFTDTTTPAMKTWAGKGLGIPLTEIAENNGVITFLVCGGHSGAEVPVAIEPSEIGEDYFVAAWNESEGAVNYRLTVEAVYGEGQNGSVVADFGDDAMAILPGGWKFIGSTGINSTYTSNGNYGNSAPSLKLTKTGDGFQTEEFVGDVVEIKLWMKGMGNDSPARVELEGLINGNWTSITSLTPTSNKVTTHDIRDIPAGTKSVQLKFKKGNMGNVAIDDFEVIYSLGSSKVLPDYDNVEVGNVTSVRVDRLASDTDSYRYKVSAVDADGYVSAFSNTVSLTVGEQSGITDVITDENAPTEYYNLQGIRVDNPSSGTYIVRRGNSVTKLILR